MGCGRSGRRADSVLVVVFPLDNYPSTGEGTYQVQLRYEPRSRTVPMQNISLEHWRMPFTPKRGVQEMFASGKGSFLYTKDGRV